MCIAHDFSRGYSGYIHHCAGGTVEGGKSRGVAGSSLGSPFKKLSFSFLSFFLKADATDMSMCLAKWLRV